MEKLKKKHFKDLLECPVCYHTINSVPIYQCHNGHVVCKDCHPKLENCPICRDDLLCDGPIRNLKLEEIVKNLKVSDSTSEIIQMDPTEVHEDTNQRTRLVEDDENLTSAPCCAPANQQFCSRKLWVFHDIE